ncbi:aminodeoxychorismate lyase [Thiolapillus sp.]
MIRSLLNGIPRDQLSVLDRGLQFGDGLFETLAIVENNLCLWDQHMQRLQAGCARLGIAAPDCRLLRQEATRLVADQRQAALKIIITRGVSERGYKPATAASPTRILSLSSWDGPCSDPLRVSVSHRRLGWNPDLAGIKHLNRLEQVLARMDCAEDVQEALMLDMQDQVVEGIMSNLFFHKRQQLFTPSLDQCGVEGVVRKLVLAMAKDRDIEIITGRFTLDEVLQSDALYLTSALGGIRFVSEITGHDWKPKTSFHPFLAEVAERVFCKDDSVC